MVKNVSKLCCLCFFVLMLGSPALAQNTKGDKPTPSNRETRFKTPKKSSQKKRPARKARTEKRSRQQGLPPSESRRGERAGRPIRPTFEKSSPRKRQRAWKGDITGRRIRPREASGRAFNVYPQPDHPNYSSRDLKRKMRNNDNPNLKRVRKMMDRHERARARPGKRLRPVYSRSRPRQKERAWTGDITGRRIRSHRSDNLRRGGVANNTAGVKGSVRHHIPSRRTIAGQTSSRARNYTRRKFYVNNRSQRPSAFGLGGAGWMQRHPGERPRAKNGKVVPRSASAAYRSRKSINVWARFRRPSRKHERAINTDLAGNKLRTRNFETKRPEIANPTLKYKKRVARGERAYKGPSGGFVTRRPGQKAWKGDVAHWPVRGGKSPGGKAIAGRKIPRRPPGIGATGIGKYRGNIRVRRRAGDQGEGYAGNIRVRRGFNDQGEEYSGNIKMGGRRGYRNQGEGYKGNQRGRRGFNDQGEGYTGNIKARRRGFRAQGEGYSGNIRVRRGFNDQGEEYTGNIRANRPDKGGGSVSGKVWNNNNRPIARRIPKGGTQIARYQGNIRANRRGYQNQGEEFSGNIKAKRPLKGGGSVSGKLWNNHETPIPGRIPKGGREIARYQGDIRVRKGYQDQGEEFSGYIKAKKPLKGGGSVSGKLWNNNETPIPGRIPKGGSQIARYQGDIRAKKKKFGHQGEESSGHIKLARNAYKRNPNSPSSALPVYKAKNQEGGDFSGNLKFTKNSYRRNPNSSRYALAVKKPAPATEKASRYLNARRSWDYVKNPSTADASLRTREPGRAFGQSAAYQGSIKIKKFDLFGKSDLHPDAKFVKLNKNNVAGEKDLLTNFKLWWARLFNKNDTQPDHLKEKERKPRYDNGEAGMWYE